MFSQPTTDPITPAMPSREPDALTLSVHADPARFYPFFLSHAHETDEGAGLGYKLNIPLPRGSGDNRFMRGLADRLAHERTFA